MRAAERPDYPADIVRPFIWVALASFSAGFWGYIAFAPVLRAALG